MLGEFQRSLGLELSGPKNDRSALAVIDYYPRTQRLVLVDIKAQHFGNIEKSSDEALIESISGFCAKCRQFSGLSIHGPLAFPPYLQNLTAHSKRHPLSFKDKNPEVRWMNSIWEQLKPRPKAFLPYMQRPVEIWLKYLTPEKFQIPDVMGANAAPLAARLHFLKPHLPKKIFEVLPRASITRIVSSLGLPKTLYRDYSDVEKGLSTREHFFSQLIKKFPQIFIYEKDLDAMIVHVNFFNAFLAAFTQHLISVEETETPPKKFPKSSAWIHIPKSPVSWDKVFYKH